MDIENNAINKLSDITEETEILSFSFGINCRDNTFLCNDRIFNMDVINDLVQLINENPLKYPVNYDEFSIIGYVSSCVKDEDFVSCILNITLTEFNKKEFIKKVNKSTWCDIMPYGIGTFNKDNQIFKYQLEGFSLSLK